MERGFVAYMRVSTERQGRSGLGLDAQRAAIVGYIKAGQGKVSAEFVEVESGKQDARPQLINALTACKRYGAILIIAKLDRLARNVAFIAALMQSGVEFIAVDMPQANKLTIHLMAAVAEHEREAISARTKAALEQTKLHGVRLGNPQGLRPDAAEKGRIVSALVRTRKSREYAEQFRPIIVAYKDAGLSLRAIARRMSEDGELAPRGGTSWTVATVRRIIADISHKK
jgi:DNA invertase Pin-like site-specific DNA recombinase